MYMRLAFAVAAHLEPEILLVDEVLAVGDVAFQKKCLGKMDDVATHGRTVLFVSHQMNQIRRLCGRCIWLDSGDVTQVGPTAEVINRYEASHADLATAMAAEPSSRGASFLAWSLGAPGSMVHTLKDFGPATVRFVLRVDRPIRNGHHGITLSDRDGFVLWGAGTDNLDLAVGVHEIVYTFETLPLRPGPYRWHVSLFDADRFINNFDCVPELSVETIPLGHRRDEFAGVMNLPIRRADRSRGQPRSRAGSQGPPPRGEALAHMPHRDNTIVIVGAGGHAMVVADLAELSGYSIVGFIDDVNVERRGQPFCRATVLGGAEQLAILARSGVHSAVIAIGDCTARLQLAERTRAVGLNLPVLCHPMASVARDSTIGPGTVVMAGAVVNPGASIGANVIVNTAASVDHECHIDEGVHVGLACGWRPRARRPRCRGWGSAASSRIAFGLAPARSSAPVHSCCATCPVTSWHSGRRRRSCDESIMQKQFLADLAILRRTAGVSGEAPRRPAEHRRPEPAARADQRHPRPPLAHQRGPLRAGVRARVSPRPSASATASRRATARWRSRSRSVPST